MNPKIYRLPLIGRKYPPRQNLPVVHIRPDNTGTIGGRELTQWDLIRACQVHPTCGEGCRCDCCLIADRIFNAQRP